ncbi:MATE family efflux transporter [Breznakiella homolactica]|uniref:Polysaccharide biosynthesis C-terminal domain-containing protein n=1 Tax=Breznakiella homolactica TaxID=2798577 RepID=A0A7T7XP22_9SPIR|nr:MATE family efflux transporter [Breznakiella homolactica]QQO09778.1 polysaccharide biosynthesis C-terminal domain-containing protein [Breznakiella homolactica]
MKRFGPASFYREALNIAVPVMLQQLIMSLVSLIDNFMVAGLGDVSMAAVNVANQLNFICIVVINAISAAGGIYLAQYKGAGNTEGMKHAYRFKVIFGLSASTLYLILCWVIPEPMLRMMTHGNAAQDAIIPIGATYLRLVSFTFLFQSVSTAIGTSFREISRPKIPLLISALATLVNTIGNWFLIYGNLGAPRLEVNGAAYATILARIFEVTVFVIYVNREKTVFYVKFKEILKVNKHLVKEILIRSAMMFMSEASWVTSETVITALYNGRGGAEVVAGMAAGWTMANIFFLVFNGIFATTAVVIGGTLGAGKLDEARKRAQWIKSGAVVGGFAVAILGALFSIIIIPLVFGNLSAEARRITMGLVAVILVYMPLWALLNSQFAISRAGGDTALGMWTDVSVNTLLFIPGAFLLAWFTNWGPVAMYAVLKLTDIIKYFIARHLLKKEKWVKNLAGESRVTV